MEAYLYAFKLNSFEIDAATLYAKWYWGKPETGWLCTNLRSGPDELDAHDPAKDNEQTLCGVSGWSVERCEKARKKLASWDIDFEWTKAQQEIGAEFGFQQCQDDGKTAKKSDTAACDDDSKSAPTASTSVVK